MGVIPGLEKASRTIRSPSFGPTHSQRARSVILRVLGRPWGGGEAVETQAEGKEDEGLILVRQGAMVAFSVAEVSWPNSMASTLLL